MNPLPRKTRWLALAAGCITAIAGSLSFGFLFPIIPGLLVVGALIQGKSSKSGKLLMWVGASLLSATVLPIGVYVLMDSIVTLRRYHDVNAVGMIGLWSASVLLVALTDAALISEAFRNRY